MQRTSYWAILLLAFAGLIWWWLGGVEPEQVTTQPPAASRSETAAAPSGPLSQAPPAAEAASGSPATTAAAPDVSKDASLDNTKTVPHPHPWPVASAPVPPASATRPVADASSAPGTDAVPDESRASKGVPHPFPWPVAGDPRAHEAPAAAGAEPQPSGGTPGGQGLPHPFPWPVAYDVPQPAAGAATSTDDAQRATKSEETMACQNELARISSSGTILFRTASDEIDPQSAVTLKALAAAAKSCAKVRITVEGHTDSRGADSTNKALSEQRAQAIVKYLTGAGVDAARLAAVGYGEERPIAPNDTEANMARNRRIEFRVN